MRALSVLSLKDNRLLTAEAGQILSDMVATNTVLKDLDLSSNNWGYLLIDLKGDGPGFAQQLAVGISNNGALSYETVTIDSFVAFLQKVNPKLVPRAENIHGSMSTAQLLEFANGAFDEAPEVTVIPKAKGAMTSLNLSNNDIGQLVRPEGWMTQKKNGKTLYYKAGAANGQWEAPVGSKAEGIIAIANAIPDMRAMTSLNLASNRLGVSGANIMAAILPKCT
jgi:hypothetical protein